RPAETGFVLDWAGVPAARDSVLRALVRPAAELLLGPLHGRVKHRPGPRSRRRFLDRREQPPPRSRELQRCRTRSRRPRSRLRQSKLKRKDAKLALVPAKGRVKPAA